MNKSSSLPTPDPIGSHHHHHQRAMFTFSRIISQLTATYHPRSLTFHLHKSSSSFRCRTSYLVLFVALLLNVISPSAQEGFDIDKLLEYNSLASCIGQIHKDFEQCNTKGAEKAKSFQVDLGDEWNKRLQCCGMWKLRDCWMKAARTKCTKAQAEQVYKLPHLFLPGLAQDCSEFTPESGKCTIPMWLIASVVSAGVILLLTCLCGTLYCIRRFRRRRARLHRPHGHRHHRRSSSNPSQATQLMTHPPKVHLNGNGTKNGVATKNGSTIPSILINQPYMNGTGHAKPVDDGTGEEYSALNGPKSPPPV